MEFYLDVLMLVGAALAALAVVTVGGLGLVVWLAGRPQARDGE